MSDKPKTAQQAAAEKRGPIRNLLESIGMAVLMAVLLKYFCLEAYVIPTPSMQPTMMGSPKAGESDRILVDKFYYLLHEPKRWDIAVFRYPVRRVQSYVKRIVGVGGDRIKIIAGNLYNVGADGKTLTILRKPDSIQSTLWREIYPMRQKLELFDSGKDVDAVPATGDIFNAVFRGRGGKWEVRSDDGAFVGTPSNNQLRLTYDPSAARNNYVDGYDLEVASSLRKERPNVGSEGVHDLAIDFGLEPTNAPDRVEVAIEVGSAGIVFSLQIDKGQATLRAVRKATKKELISPTFPFEVAAGSTTAIRFEHRDDQLIAFRDGDEVQRFVVDGMAILSDAKVGSISPRVTVIAKGASKFHEVRIERDLHYTRSQLGADEIIEVPAGHFFMMGDNTLGSADGRDWTAIKIGVDKDNNIVSPKSPAAVRTLWGNKRPKQTFGGSDPGHDDDNPVPMLTTDQVVFDDEVGEIHALQGKVDHKSWATEAAKYRIEFVADAPWQPEEKPARFVPRAHIQGRPIARFLRSLGGLKFFGWIR